MRVSLSKNMPISVLLSLGALKIGYDFCTDKEKNKKDVFVRDSVIMGSSILGVVAAQKSSDRLIKKQSMQKLINKVTEFFTGQVPKNSIKTKEFANITQNCLKDCFCVTSAILTGLIGAEVLNHTYFKRKKQPKLMETNIKNLKPNYNVLANPEDGIENVSKMFEKNFRILKTIDGPLAVFDAIKIAEEKKLDTKVKMTMYEIIANALLPTFCISLAMSLTKNTSKLKRACVVGASGVVGLYSGHKLAVGFNKKYSPQITETVKEIREDITESLSFQLDN